MFTFILLVLSLLCLIFSSTRLIGIGLLALLLYLYPFIAGPLLLGAIILYFIFKTR